MSCSPQGDIHPSHRRMGAIAILRINHNTLRDMVQKATQTEPHTRTRMTGRQPQLFLTHTTAILSVNRRKHNTSHTSQRRSHSHTMMVQQAHRLVTLRRGLPVIMIMGLIFRSLRHPLGSHWFHRQVQMDTQYLPQLDLMDIRTIRRRPLLRPGFCHHHPRLLHLSRTQLNSHKYLHRRYTHQRQHQ